jgi:hypothetical protein
VFIAPEVSPFEDPTPSLIVPPAATNSDSETNPFRVRNSSSNTTIPPTAPALPATQTMPAAAAPADPALKSKNPFLDMPSEDNIPSPKVYKHRNQSNDQVSEEVKTSPRKPVPTNGRSRPIRPRPADPNAPSRPRSPHRRPHDPNHRPSARDREKMRERRDRPPTDPSRRPRPRSASESSLPKDRSSRREDGHVHKSRSKPLDKKDEKKKAARRLHPVDKIDLLDVTGAFGSISPIILLT